MKLTKRKLAHIVFESNDRPSRTFDVVLLILIFGSVIVAVLDSVTELKEEYGRLFFTLELIFTFLFTIEYALRVWLTSKTFRYVSSFYGIVDRSRLSAGNHEVSLTRHPIVSRRGNCFSSNLKWVPALQPFPGFIQQIQASLFCT